MKRLYSFILFLSLLCMLSRAISISSRSSLARLLLKKASQNPCPSETEVSNPPEGCIWLFEDYSKRFEICEDAPDFRQYNFDKLPISIQLNSNTNIALYSEYNYTGEFRVYNVSGSYKLLDFLCMASSAKFIINQDNTNADCLSLYSSPPEGCVWLFEDYYKRFEVCEDTPDFRSYNFDKLPISIQLNPNTKIALYSDYNYAGESKVFSTSGSFQLLDFLCMASSLKFIYSYTIRGYIKNGVTNEIFSSSDLQAVSIVFTNVNTGQSYPAEINSNSTYVVHLTEKGLYQRNSSMTNKINTGTTIDIASSSDESTSENTVYFSDVIRGWRAILSWNTAQDLDTHMYLPDNTHVYWRKKNSTDGCVKLDIDDQTGKGPETLTIDFLASSAPKSGSYKYFVRSYSNLPLNTSEAKVVVYHGDTQIGEYRPPLENPNINWYVFRVEYNASSGTDEYFEVNRYQANLS